MAPPIHVFHAFSTFGGGGPQFRMAAIVNRLGRAFRHTLMAMDGNLAACDRFDPQASIATVPPPQKTHFAAPAIRDLIRRADPDLVITYNWGAIDALAGALLAGVPVIHHEHGFGADEAQRLKARRVLARRALLPLAFRTIVPSLTLREIALRSYGLDPEQVQFIPNGVDVDAFRPHRDDVWRRRLGLGDGALLFGYIGLLRPEKNLPLLVRAFAGASISGAKLLLVGKGPCHAELESLVDGLHLHDRVILAGDTAVVAAVLGALDVFVMSSTTEQMPMSLLEAMACGLPAVCTDVGDIRAMLGENAARVLPPSGDLRAYVAALETIARERDLRGALGTANRRRCEELYSLARMAQAYADAFREAAAYRRC